MFASFLDEISTITDSANIGNEKNEQNIFLGKISIDESSIRNRNIKIQNYEGGIDEMMRVNMKSELDSLMVRNNLSQKEAAGGSGIPFSTFNGYTKGSQEVPINKAVEINNAVGDDLFASQVGNKYLGTLKALDGKIAEILTPTELDFLQEEETKQREERRQQAKLLLIKSKLEPLNNEDKTDLEKYVMEFLDEIVVELSIIFSILKILGMNVSTAFKKRMPHWVAKKYMKGD